MRRDSFPSVMLFAEPPTQRRPPSAPASELSNVGLPPSGRGRTDVRRARQTVYAIAGTRRPARSTTSATATVASTQAEATTKASW